MIVEGQVGSAAEASKVQVCVVKKCTGRPLSLTMGAPQNVSMRKPVNEVHVLSIVSIPKLGVANKISLYSSVGKMNETLAGL
jgi:hypothetical protein